jgi:hypothetical protein
VYTNTINNYSSISYNNITQGVINGNVLNNSAAVSNNQILLSGINYNTIPSWGSISYNTLENSSTIQNSTLSNSHIKENKLQHGGRIDGSGYVLSNKSLLRLTVNNAIIDHDLNNANEAFFANYTREVFKSANGTARLKYYTDNSVVLTDILWGE